MRKSVIVGSLICHFEQAFLRRERCGRAARCVKAFCDTILARLARFL
jgi:hypothetical protein